MKTLGASTLWLAVLSGGCGSHEKTVCSNESAYSIDIPHACRTDGRLPICLTVDTSNPGITSGEFSCCIQVTDNTKLYYVQNPCEAIVDGHRWRACVDDDYGGLDAYHGQYCDADGGVDAGTDAGEDSGDGSAADGGSGD